MSEPSPVEASIEVLPPPTPLQAALSDESQPTPQQQQQEEPQAASPIPVASEDVAPSIGDTMSHSSVNTAPVCSSTSTAPALPLHCAIGFPADKRYNLHYIDEDVLLYAAGSTFQLLRLSPGVDEAGRALQQVFFAHSATTLARGIGAVAVHPSKKYFAVAEKVCCS